MSPCDTNVCCGFDGNASSPTCSACSCTVSGRFDQAGFTTTSVAFGVSLLALLVLSCAGLLKLRCRPERFTSHAVMNFKCFSQGKVAGMIVRMMGLKFLSGLVFLAGPLALAISWGVNVQGLQRTNGGDNS
jgi:hypothetical protein